MTTVEIDFARSREDMEAARALCREFVNWQLEQFPRHRDAISTYFSSKAWEKVLADLPQIHARPKGGILLARHDGTPVGCIMYQEMEPGISEVKRLFVTPEARGMGAGKALVASALDHMRHDGYETARLDTADFLTTAIGLYGKSGFELMPAPDGLPPELAARAVFMQRQL